MRRPVCALLACGLASLPPTRGAADPRAWFDRGVEADLAGEGAGSTAFAFFRRAADAGLPEAELNVAVMLDSGRGVRPDIAEAATWYARAAARGNARAAYNLGQLYEAGQGVPKNPAMARVWYAASSLPAARERRVLLRPHASGAAVLTAPKPTAPVAGATTSTADGQIELVWMAEQEPASARFFVEMLKIEPSGWREVFSTFSERSSLLAPVPEREGDYAWRVFALSRTSGAYAASAWLRFRVTRG